VVATCYSLGVSTRRMDKPVQSLGLTTLSKSQDSEIAKDLDTHVEQFRTRPLDDTGPFPAADALMLNLRVRRWLRGAAPQQSRWAGRRQREHPRADAALTAVM
jgi:transposase-like protein